MLEKYESGVAFSYPLSSVAVLFQLSFVSFWVPDIALTQIFRVNCVFLLLSIPAWLLYQSVVPAKTEFCSDDSTAETLIKELFRDAGGVREQARGSEAPGYQGILGLKGEKAGNYLLQAQRAGSWAFAQQEPLLWRLAATLRALLLKPGKDEEAMTLLFFLSALPSPARDRNQAQATVGREKRKTGWMGISDIHLGWFVFSVWFFFLW